MTGGCSCKKRKDSHTQRNGPWEDAARSGLLQARDRGSIGNCPCQHLALLASGTVREYISLFRPPSVWCFVSSSKLAWRGCLECAKGPSPSPRKSRTCSPPPPPPDLIRLEEGPVLQCWWIWLERYRSLPSCAALGKSVVSGDQSPAPESPWTLLERWLLAAAHCTPFSWVPTNLGKSGFAVSPVILLNQNLSEIFIFIFLQCKIFIFRISQLDSV